MWEASGQSGFFPWESWEHSQLTWPGGRGWDTGKEKTPHLLIIGIPGHPTLQPRIPVVNVMGALLSPGARIQLPTWNGVMRVNPSLHSVPLSRHQPSVFLPA